MVARRRRSAAALPPAAIRGTGPPRRTGVRGRTGGGHPGDAPARPVLPFVAVLLGGDGAESMGGTGIGSAALGARCDARQCLTSTTRTPGTVRGAGSPWPPAGRGEHEALAGAVGSPVAQMTGKLVLRLHVELRRRRPRAALRTWRCSVVQFVRRRRINDAEGSCPAGMPGSGCSNVDAAGWSIWVLSMVCTWPIPVHVYGPSSVPNQPVVIWAGADVIDGLAAACGSSWHRNP